MENNYVFKDSAPNTIENAYFDNPQPKIPFRMRIKEKMHTTKPMILMGAASLLILLVTWLSNLLGNVILQKFYEQGNTFLINYSYSSITACITNIATVVILIVFGKIAYKKFIGMLKFAGCYTAAALVGELFFSIGRAITFVVIAMIDNGDLFVHSYYGQVLNILSIISVVISFGLSILFTRLLIRKG